MTWRKFPSRWRWNAPHDAAWLGATIAFRLALPITIVWILVTQWRG